MHARCPYCGSPECTCFDADEDYAVITEADCQGWEQIGNTYYHPGGYGLMWVRVDGSLRLGKRVIPDARRADLEELLADIAKGAA
jgi:hypothetical protein